MWIGEDHEKFSIFMRWHALRSGLIVELWGRLQAAVVFYCFHPFLGLTFR
jgi:hypothetical protein